MQPQPALRAAHIGWLLALVSLCPTAYATPKLCTRGGDVDAIARTQDAAIVCQSGDKRECWQIDGRGRFSVAPPDRWLPADDSVAGDHVGPAARDEGALVLITPDEVSVKVSDDDGHDVIDVCTNGVCKQLRPKQRKNLDDVRAVTLLPDGHTLLVGQGLTAAAAAQLARYDLAHPGARTELAKCAEVLDLIAGNILVQQTDCANEGGPRLLFSPGGKRLASLGTFFASSQPYFAVGGTRWLFVGYKRFAVWDFANGQELSSLPVCSS